MQKVKIQSVSRKDGVNEKGPWVNTRITGEDGAVFGTFHKGAQELKEGDLIELEPIVKGKNVNFDKWDMLEESKGIPAAPCEDKPTQYRGKSLEVVQLEVNSKARNTALMQACELAKVDRIKVDDIFNKADRFYSWLQGGKVETTKAIQTIKVTSESEDKRQGIEPESREATKSPDINALKELPIKDLGALFSACLKYFKMNQTATLQALGGITKEQISDVKDAWLQIVESKEDKP